MHFEVTFHERCPLSRSDSLIATLHLRHSTRQLQQPVHTINHHVPGTGHASRVQQSYVPGNYLYIQTKRSSSTATLKRNSNDTARDESDVVKLIPAGRHRPCLLRTRKSQLMMPTDISNQPCTQNRRELCFVRLPLFSAAALE